MPIMFLAIALQVLLPVAMVRSFAATLDPFSHSTICSTEPTNSGGSAQHKHTLCPVCQFAAASDVALPASVTELPLPAVRSGPTVADPAQSAGPRGPPHSRPPATGPPSLA
jgi:hypothetical protein